MRKEGTEMLHQQMWWHCYNHLTQKKNMPSSVLFSAHATREVLGLPPLVSEIMVELKCSDNWEPKLRCL